MRSSGTALCVIALMACLAQISTAAPIQRIKGAIRQVERGHLWLTPDGETTGRKFIFRWKVRFDPPKLPLRGDRVLILYKTKPEGDVIYGVKYLTPDFPDPAPADKEEATDKDDLPEKAAGDPSLWPLW